jgi:glycosyltransferase involved in cell wall biosynthesis
MKQKIVILSAFATPFRSGAEACSEEVSALLQSSYDITIVTSRLSGDLPKEDTLSSGVKLLRVGFGMPLDKWLFPFLGALAVRRLRPNLVHAVLESFAGMALVWCRFLAPSAQRMLTCQSTNTRLLLGPIHRSAHGITCISTPLIDRAARLGRSDAVLIPNGLHLQAFEEARASVKRIPGRILFVGRLEPMKGVDTLLKALALMIETPTLDVSTEAHLRIVGDGSQRSALEAWSRTLGIAERVTFAGRAEPGSIAKEYAGAEIFCGLSRSEALGNVFLEAQAAGCSVVASNVGGIPDIVLDGETGMLIEPDDAQAAADALGLLLKDAALRHRLAKAAIVHAASYDWAGIADGYHAMYERLLAQADRR